MLSTETGLWVQFPSESPQRVLHPAKIVKIVEDTYTIELDDCDPQVDAGQSINIYFESGRDFVKQCATVRAVGQSEPTAVIGFQTIGDPVSAENRQCYRVSTTFCDIYADVGELSAVQVVDVSATGLSFISGEPLSTGDILNVSVSWEGMEYEGGACLQSMKPLPDGRTRYGLHCLHNAGHKGTLEQGLRQISLAVQRQQLRRLSGTG